MQQNEAHQDDVDGIPNTSIMKDSGHLSTAREFIVKGFKRPLHQLKKFIQTLHHIHDSEDVGLHIITAMVLDKFGVSHHHGLHPTLSTD